MRVVSVEAVAVSGDEAEDDTDEATTDLLSPDNLTLSSRRWSENIAPGDEKIELLSNEASILSRSLVV